MPFADPERKRQARKSWAARQSPAYHKWLYERRALRFWKAVRYEWALEEIVRILVDSDPKTPAEQARNLAQAWLEEGRAIGRDLGNKFDHEKGEGVYVPGVE